ncbi:katanin p80 WD40 repeat-containing subunit B1 isoform X1 [Cebus imitator]|uniref:katanin p80 WD40 repeat-containing subunit B1 isoform X1 n=1 Tax=Cebus imitator TaxID=2715852 RepID=UPI000809B654|nr:katanin p80 WD40 repeat-containing subunit B1 isoform X1 [Cebus imitator]
MSTSWPPAALTGEEEVRASRSCLQLFATVSSACLCSRSVTVWGVIHLMILWISAKPGWNPAPSPLLVPWPQCPRSVASWAGLHPRHLVGPYRAGGLQLLWPAQGPGPSDSASPLQSQGQPCPSHCSWWPCPGASFLEKLVPRGLWRPGLGERLHSTAWLPLQDHPLLGPGEVPGGELHRRGAWTCQVRRHAWVAQRSSGQQGVAAGGPFPSLLCALPAPGSLGSLGWGPGWVPQDPEPSLAWPRSVLFNPDGCCLYSGCQDSLRVYGWEPERCFDVILVNWGKVADLAICNDQLVREPWRPPPPTPTGPPAFLHPRPLFLPHPGAGILPSQLTGPAPTFHFLQIGVAFSQSNVSSYVVDLTRVTRTGTVARDPVQDHRPLAQPPPNPSAPLRRIYERPSTTCSRPQRVKQNSESERRSPSSEDDRDERESRAEIQNAEDYNEIFQPKNSISRTPPRRIEPFPAPPEDDVATAKEAAKPSPAMDVQFPVPNLEVLPRPLVVASTPAPAPKAEPAIIPATRNEPIGLKASDFLPAVKISQQAELVDDDAMSQIRKGHDTMCVVLTSRHKNLDTVRAVWTTSDIKTSVDSAVAINDLSVVVDLLNIVNQKASLWKLDLCTTVLPQIEKLLQSKYESYVQTGCTSLKLILQRFLPLITDMLAAPPSVGVDISREERLHKCRLCHKQLKSISGLVKSKSGLSGRHGSTFRELHLLMASLD